MDWTAEIKDSKGKRVQFISLTSCTKSRLLEKVQDFISKHQDIKGKGYSCVVKSFSWTKGVKVSANFNI